VSYKVTLLIGGRQEVLTIATITKGQKFSATETITNTKLHNLVDLATVTGIVNADIDASAAIVDTKLAGITTAGTVNGSSLAGLNNIPSGAGVIPAANLTSVAQKGANSDITSLSGLTTPLSVAQGGTGGATAANARTALGLGTAAVLDVGTTASKVVQLDGSAKLPAVDGSQLTGLSAVTQANDTGGENFSSTTLTTFLSQAKTITSGKTVMLVATGYCTASSGGGGTIFTITLKQGSTVVQTVYIYVVSDSFKYPWAVSGIVTGLSGSITFTVSAAVTGGSGTHQALGNLEILEF